MCLQNKIIKIKVLFVQYFHRNKRVFGMRKFEHPVKSESGNVIVVESFMSKREKSRIKRNIVYIFIILIYLNKIEVKRIIKKIEKIESLSRLDIF